MKILLTTLANLIIFSFQKGGFHQKMRTHPILLLLTKTIAVRAQRQLVPVDAQMASFNHLLYRYLVDENSKCQSQTEHLQDILGTFMDSPARERSPFAVMNFTNGFFESACEGSEENAFLLCDLSKESIAVEPFCTAGGGRMMPINIHVSCHDEEILHLMHIPFCAGLSCDGDNLLRSLNANTNNTHFEEISELITYDGDEYETNCSIHFTISKKINKCFEVPIDAFSIDISRGEKVVPLRRKCKWLQKLSSVQRAKYCKSLDAKKACPLSCCTCSSSNERRKVFLKKILILPKTAEESRHDAGKTELFVENGNGMKRIPIIKTCGWLEKKNTRAKKRYCSVRRGASLYGHLPAWKQCPSVCGFCAF